MARRSWVWCQKLKELVEITPGAAVESRAPMVVPDLPGYVSPVTGLWVEGRKARRDDMARTGSRPWEGFAQEHKESERQRAYTEQRQDQRLEVATRAAYHQMPPDKRRILEGR